MSSRFSDGSPRSSQADRDTARGILAALGRDLKAAEPLPSVAEVESLLASRLAGFEDSREGFIRWLRQMARDTYARALRPLPRLDETLLERLRSLLAERPGRDPEHAQLHIDVESVLRRAMVIRELDRVANGPVVVVGDDDGVSVALAMLDEPDLIVLDIDPRVVFFVRSVATELGAAVLAYELDFFEEPVPAEIRRRAARAVTDPIRNEEATLQFCLVAAACLTVERPSRLLLADHPDWNVELDGALLGLEQAGFRVSACHELFHAYPLEEAFFSELGTVEEAAGLEAGALDPLIAATRAYTHLYELARERRIG